MTRIVLLLLSLTWILGAQQWPAFRGPMGSGVNEAANPPVKWNGETGENIAWKTPIPGISTSSPVVWGGKVFVVTSVSADPKAEFRHGLFGDVEPSKDTAEHEWKIYCLDRRTGDILWERLAYKGVPKVKRHPKSSFSSPSPVTDGKRVVAWFGSEGVYAWDMDGKPLWKREAGVLDQGWFFDPDYQWGAASSPMLWQDLVLLQADQQQGSWLAAWDAATGKEVWRVERDEIPGWATPVVLEHEGAAQLVTNSTKRIRGHDPRTGKLLWELGGNSEITVTTPVLGGGLIFVANGYPPIQPIYAIKWGARGDITLKEGEEANAGLAWSKKRGGPYMPTPLVYGGLLYLCSNNGVLSAYRVTDGERVLQQRVAGKGGAFSASPIAARGRLYLTSEDGEVHVLQAGEKPETLSSNPMGEVLMATPALVDDMIIVRGMKHVFAIREPKVE
ncbi:MAG TPA: PQQ-binding-like beta-propeller repeat protein [Bryobacteraceae bacterium]|nr:hypothetical protein [Bryobacterales bacterium]HRJ21620.1 PQQ-binding-like beta-propeller repeat protein [Bryobacteraceae bacterium]